MSIQTTLRKLAPFAAASLLLIGASAGANAFQCKVQNEAGVGSAFLQGVAITKSKANWTNAVKGKHGLEWSVWNIAAAPSQNCAKNGNRFQCTVSAKPCKYVVQ